MNRYYIKGKREQLLRGAYERSILLIPLSTGWYGKRRAGVLRRTIGGGPRLRVDLLLFHTFLVRARQQALEALQQVKSQHPKAQGASHK
jgi:hypothetical protein